MVKKFSKKKKIIISIFSVFLVLILAGCGTVYYVLNHQLAKIKTTPISKKASDLGINTQVYTEDKKDVTDQYVNILLLGTDLRNPDGSSRSDSNMIATIDKKHNTIKLSSLMRDMIVDMEGRGPMQGLNQDRLNSAYEHGGPQEAVKVVNENFKMNIKDFVRVDFQGLEKIIDALGGVEINVDEDEIPVLNSYERQLSGIENVKDTPVTKAGKQLLNGRQAVGYSRIRYVGDNDFQRTERQRTVLTEIFNKLSKQSLLDINNDLGEFLPNVETSLDKGTILDLAKYVITNKVKTVKQLRIPIDGHNFTQYVNNTYFLGWDKKENLEALHKFIYEEDYDDSILK